MTILIALMIAATPAERAPTPPDAKPVCLRTETSPAVEHAEPNIHPLDREPAAQQGLAVVRTFGGCRVPVVVARGVPTR